MNGHRFLADTNTFIFLLDKHPSLETFLKSDWHFSFITEIELLGKTGITTNEVKHVKELLSTCHKIAFNDVINQLTISLKQRLKIKLPDAIIAATAIHNNLPILTFDKGFSKIEAIDVILLEP